MKPEDLRVLVSCLSNRSRETLDCDIKDSKARRIDAIIAAFIGRKTILARRRAWLTFQRMAQCALRRAETERNTCLDHPHFPISPACHYHGGGHGCATRNPH